MWWHGAIEQIREATFDPEHGIGLLTDGHQILGTGYQMDVSPFE